MKFYHSDIAFGEVVIEWGSEVDGEPQVVVAAGGTAPSEGCSFLLVFGARPPRDGWFVGAVTGSNKASPAAVDPVEHRPLKAGGTSVLGFFDDTVGVAQQIGEISSPTLVWVGGCSVEFTEEMRTTELMDNLVTVIGGPGVMNSNAPEPVWVCSDRVGGSLDVQVVGVAEIRERHQ